MRRWRRTGYAAVSGLAGWLVAQALCVPILLITAVRDSEGQPRLFVQTMLYGGVAWAGWTFLLGTVAWVLVVWPLVMTVRPCLLVRLRYWVLALGTGFALWLATRRPAMFRDPTGVTLLHRFESIIPYTVYAVGFTVVTAGAYLLLSKRWLDQRDAEARMAAMADAAPQPVERPS
ncbi:MAG: hypothetical protein JWM54_78 [Acidobacteriaceae bacterium]|nr:hypothetical protein [Acidobacteriaceae bacterium]